MFQQRAAMFAIVAVLMLGAPLAVAESNDEVPARFSYVEGEDNIPAGCTHFEVWTPEGAQVNEFIENPCHQIATSMNGLDTPKIDVLILVPVSPAAERDMSIMRQSIEMWADGIEWMATDMGLQWLADGIEFHVSVDTIDMNDDGESEFTTYPIVDPEIVIIASNPVGGIGIGIDPLDFAGAIGGIFGQDDLGQGPCHGVANPFDMSAWEAIPGYDSHHDGRGGTYVEDCDGAGGNICFAVNGAIDPDPSGTIPSAIDFQLFDLVSHEVGHCLTLGHVGDGAEGVWDSVPTNDIMAYDSDPVDKSKCVSSLNVEAFVVTMSHFLDSNGDDVVDEADYIWANDAEGLGDERPFQIQQPDNHYYASNTREAVDCPQPDFSPVPMSETLNFTPEAFDRTFVAIDNFADGASVAQGLVSLQGHVGGNAADARTVQLSLENQTNVTTPLRTDGTWSGNVDLSLASLENGTVVWAKWLDSEGMVIDSDRVMLFANETVLVDSMTVQSADAGPGSAFDAESANTPGIGPLALGAVLLVAAVATRRRR